jgi:hypothetical protein
LATAASVGAVLEVAVIVKLVDALRTPSLT